MAVNGDRMGTIERDPVLVVPASLHAYRYGLLERGDLELQ
jgi:hypothetical protein